MNTAEWCDVAEHAGAAYALQWSRRVNTAECEQAPPAHLLSGASMEPPCEHGGVRELVKKQVAARMLQWSRRVNTAEWDVTCDMTCTDSVLQWSRRVNTAE